MKSTPEQAIEFAKTKFNADLEETKADFIAVSCITCLMHMEKVQNTFNEQVGEERYKFPVFDYNQLLALCLGIDPKQVSAICNVPAGLGVKPPGPRQTQGVTGLLAKNFWQRMN